jgi:thioredoxin 1
MDFEVVARGSALKEEGKDYGEGSCCDEQGWDGEELWRAGRFGVGGVQGWLGSGDNLAVFEKLLTREGRYERVRRSLRTLWVENPTISQGWDGNGFGIILQAWPGGALMNSRRLSLMVFIVLLGLDLCSGQAAAPQSSERTSSTAPNSDSLPSNGDASFAPFEQWKSMVLAGDAAGLKALYSVNPVARIVTASREVDAAAAVHYWVALKPKSMKVDITESTSPEAGKHGVVFQAEIVTSATGAEKTFYIAEAQLWQQQGEQWRLVMSKRTEASRLQQPTSEKKNIYPANADAHAEIEEALSKAGDEHKRVLLVFGANWCYDCHVLDLAFQRADIAPILEAGFEVVHVDIGQGDKNQDLMKEYGVPVERGIPAVAVLDGNGKLLYSQKNGEFEKARSLGPEDLLEFLNKWKGT